MPVRVHPVGGRTPETSIKGLLLVLVVFFGTIMLIVLLHDFHELISIRRTVKLAKKSEIRGQERWRHPRCKDPCSVEVCKDIRRSTLYSECCYKQGLIPKPPHIYPLLISATPRSGTTGAVELLRKLGLKLSHDFTDPWPDGMVSWIHIFSEFDVIANESNTVAYPYYGFGKLNASRFASGVHLVRDPLKSITSLSCAVLRMTHETRRNASMSLSFRQFVERHTGIDSNATEINMFKAGMQMWLEWHQFMDRLCIDLVRTEALFSTDTTWDAITAIWDKVNRTYPAGTTIGRALGQTGQRTNTRKHRQTVSWKELFALDPDLALQVFDLASKYGYSWPIDPDWLWEKATYDPVPHEYWPKC